MYTFEGLTYDLVAAAIGVLVGVGVAYLMVLALSGLLESSDISIGFTVKPASIALAYSIGVLLTLMVVAYSIGGWRLRTGDPRAKVLGIILSCLALISFPVSTALGIFGLWALLHRPRQPASAIRRGEKET
jgi:hypothetical protein